MNKKNKKKINKVINEVGDVAEETISTGKVLLIGTYNFLKGHNLLPVALFVIAILILPRFFGNSGNNYQAEKMNATNIIPVKSHIPNQKYRLTVKKEDGKEDDEIYYIDKNGNVYSADSYNSKIEGTFNRFDFRLRPGIGLLVIPKLDEVEKMIEPAFILGVFELYDRISLDGIVNQNRVGGGLSIKIKTRYTENTYLGAGMTVDYKNTDNAFIVYGKINF